MVDAAEVRPAGEIREIEADVVCFRPHIEVAGRGISLDKLACRARRTCC